MQKNWLHYCKESGLEIWSIHLPFSDKWDLSNDDAEEALADDRKLIEAAAKSRNPRSSDPSEL